MALRNVVPIRPNVQRGFYDATGFHPLRRSVDYDPDEAGDEYGARTDATGFGKRKARKRTGKVTQSRSRKRRNPTGREPNEEKLLREASKPGNNIRKMAGLQQTAHDWGLYRVTAVINDWMRRVGASQQEMERHWKKRRNAGWGKQSRERKRGPWFGIRTRREKRALHRFKDEARYRWARRYSREREERRNPPHPTYAKQVGASVGYRDQQDGKPRQSGAELKARYSRSFSEMDDPALMRQIGFSEAEIVRERKLWRKAVAAFIDGYRFGYSRAKAGFRGLTSHMDREVSEREERRRKGRNPRRRSASMLRPPRGKESPRVRAALAKYVRSSSRRRNPWSISSIKRANLQGGGHYFDKNTLRFFNAKTDPRVYEGAGGVYFVSSSQFVAESGERHPRTYKVAQFYPESGRVQNVGGSQHTNLQDARAEARSRAGVSRANPGKRARRERGRLEHLRSMRGEPRPKRSRFGTPVRGAYYSVTHLARRERRRNAYQFIGRPAPGGGYNLIERSTGEVVRHVATKSAAIQALASMNARGSRYTPSSGRRRRRRNASTLAQTPGTKIYVVKIPRTYYDDGYTLTIRAKSKRTARKEAKAYCAESFHQITGKPKNQYKLPGKTSITEVRG